MRRTVCALLLAILGLGLGHGSPAHAAEGVDSLVEVRTAADAQLEGAQSNECEASDTCPDSIAPDRASVSVRGLVVIAIFAVIVVVGLRAIKRQRDEGRRSKLPPIG